MYHRVLLADLRRPDGGQLRYWAPKVAEISYYRGGMSDTNRRDLREPAASACDAECDDDGTVFAVARSSRRARLTAADAACAAKARPFRAEKSAQCDSREAPNQEYNTVEERQATRRSSVGKFRKILRLPVIT